MSRLSGHSHAAALAIAAGLLLVSLCPLVGSAAGQRGLPPRISPETPADAELPTPPERLERLESWVVAVGRHRLGVRDADSHEIGQWTVADLQGLWVDFNALVRIMRDPRAAGFSLPAANGRNTRIIYTGDQMRRLRTLACLAAGRVSASGEPASTVTMPRECGTGSAKTDLKSELRMAANVYAAGRAAGGDDNFVLRRAAVLHADVAMLEPSLGASMRSSSLPVGPRRAQVDMLDGRTTSTMLAGIHWELGETALRFVKPAAEKKAAPDRDEMVRDWYRATTMWMHLRGQYDALHIEEGRRLFPDDSILLFLSGCQHEAYAAPLVQAGIQRSSIVFRSLGSPAAEWRQAESFFRQSLSRRPDDAEARLHLGRVLAKLGRLQEGRAELYAALPSLQVESLRYYAELFLGDIEEQAGQFAAARDAYERARAIAPEAQSPPLALSQLARRRDDQDRAAATLDALFAPRSADDTQDPWWSYQVFHAREADGMIQRVWHAIETVQ